MGIRYIIGIAHFGRSVFIPTINRATLEAKLYGKYLVAVVTEWWVKSRTFRFKPVFTALRIASCTLTNGADILLATRLILNHRSNYFNILIKRKR